MKTLRTLIGLLVAALTLAACNGSSGASCNASNNTGCDGGQVCESADGGAGCFCNTTTNAGCAEGQLCQRVGTGSPACYCDPDNNTGCDTGKVCERVMDGQPACFKPVQIKGRVFNLSTNAGLADAHVVAIDASGAAASGVAVSTTDGSYTLQLPTTRTAAGVPMLGQYTLRGDAQDYQSFPGGVRTAFPVDTANPTETDTAYTIQNASTDVGLIPLPAGSRGTITGKVQATIKSGVLITGGGSTGISDRGGLYTLFNVTPGSVTVHGYAGGEQLNTATATVTASATTADVNLTESTTPTSTVSGSLQLVNAGGVSSTSVVLALEETFNMGLERGEVPRGLRVEGISGAFTFTGVPDGTYVVLPSLENDGAVRDPDTGISGTAIVHVTVPMGTNRTIALSTSFKVTGALGVISPGRDAPEAVTSATPTFQWQDDSSEDGYEIHVFDAFGTEVWANTMLPNVTGGNVSVTYAGPALMTGHYYQFRAISWRSRTGSGHTPISRTEDLRGVFFLP